MVLFLTKDVELFQYKKKKKQLRQHSYSEEITILANYHLKEFHYRKERAGLWNHLGFNWISPVGHPDLMDSPDLSRTAQVCVCLCWTGPSK